MSSECHAFERLTIRDIQAHPVWEFFGDDETADTAVRPVLDLPVSDLRGRIVGTTIRINNGTTLWAILGNVSLRNPRATKHFLCVRVEEDGRWFDLARYHDVDYRKRNAVALAAFLRLPVSDVFPIQYDISDVAVGDPAVLRGSVAELPAERLADDELIALSLED